MDAAFGRVRFFGFRTMEATEHPAPAISVIIPTYNREDILLRCLEALARQSLPMDHFEVLVVDDGSTDGTPLLMEAWRKRSPFAFSSFRQANQKQGAARNFGACHARGKYLIFLGDDILATETLLAEHLRYHREYGPGGDTAVLGYIRWAREIRVTRFMEWIGEMGWQFGFSLIKDPLDLPFNFFYTSNISLTAQRFWECNGFDEQFREYGWEDIELSFRLKDRGLRILYNPKALAYHHHPTTVASFCRRQEKVGYSALRFQASQPHLQRFLGTSSLPHYGKGKRMFLSVIRKLTEWSERCPWIDTSRYYQDLMSFHYVQGIQKAIRNEPL